MSRPEALLPGQPGDDAGAPVFAAPWQARAFALVVHLHARGAFSWRDWARALAAECAQAPVPADRDGSGYYRAWLRALEGLIASRGLADPEAVAAMTAAWHRAAEATPHGAPIRLENAAGPSRAVQR